MDLEECTKKVAIDSTMTSRSANQIKRLPASGGAAASKNNQLQLETKEKEGAAASKNNQLQLETKEKERVMSGVVIVVGGLPNVVGAFGGLFPSVVLVTVKKII